MTKRLERAIAGGGHHVTDLDFVPRRDHAVDQEFRQGAALGKGRSAESCSGLDFEVLPSGGIELPLLHDKTLSPSLQFLVHAVEFGYPAS